MKIEGLDHPKTMDLAARLEVELPTAIGYLELLWAFTGKKAPQGNIGKWPDGAIARACYWMGRPEVFTLALQEAGFIDADPMHRFTVHDWREHAPRWVKSKLSTLKLQFVDEVSGDTSGDTSADSKGSEGKPSEGKGNGAHAPIPGLNLEAWSRWTEYRRKIRKPLKPVSEPVAMEELAAFGDDQLAVVKQSIGAGWTGLFALKTVNGHAKKPEEDKAKRLEREQRSLAELRTRAGRIQFRDFNPAIDDLLGYKTLVERAESNLPRRASS